MSRPEEIGAMESGDSFRLLTEEQAGAFIGALVAALFIYDVIQRLIERFA
jgi:hypothetical protein